MLFRGEKKKLFLDARSNLLKERFLRRRLLFGRKHEFGQYTNHPATIFSPFPPLFFCLRKPIRCCSIATETIWPLNTTNRSPVTLSRSNKQQNWKFCMSVPPPPSLTRLEFETWQLESGAK